MPEAQTWRETSGRYVLGVRGGAGGAFARLWYFRRRAERDAKVTELFMSGEIDSLSRWTPDGVWLGTEQRLTLEPPDAQ